MQTVERENANRSLFVREIVISTLSQSLPDLLSQHSQQQQQQSLSDVQTPASSTTTTATTSPETPNACGAVTTKKLLILGQDVGKREQQQQSQSQSAAASTATTTTGVTKLQTSGQQPQSQGLPAANPIVQTIMHSVLPQPLVNYFDLFFRTINSP